MKAHWLGLIPALAFATTFNQSSSVVAQSPAATPANPSFAGTWEGKMNDLPGIALKIEGTDGKVKGTAIFYFQERSSADRAWHAAPSIQLRCWFRVWRARRSPLKSRTTSAMDAWSWV
jgi:hypothetical protein